MKYFLLILTIFVFFSCENTGTEYYSDPCYQVTCSNQGNCEVKDSFAMCICNDGYHTEKLNCIKNSLECEITEHEENSECISNTKMVDCIDITPNNATSSNIQTEITWKDGAWTTASNCEFTCNEGFVKDDENCIANHVPTVDNVVIIGVPRVGETLSLNYDFYDEDGDIEGDSIIVWSTPTIELQRGINRTFVIPEGYIGDTIGAWIHPIDEHDLEGEDVAASNNMLTIIPTINSNAIFISVLGNDSNDCLTEDSSCKTIQHGLDLAQPGYTVYVKSGNYGAEQIVFPRSGEENNPITLEGYKITPGDAPVYPSPDENMILDPSLMPLLNGNDLLTSSAIDLEISHILKLDTFKLKIIILL